MRYFMGTQSRYIQFLGISIKKMLLYARIQALKIKGAPDYTVETHKNPQKKQKNN